MTGLRAYAQRLFKLLFTLLIKKLQGAKSFTVTSLVKARCFDSLPVGRSSGLLSANRLPCKSHLLSEHHGSLLSQHEAASFCQCHQLAHFAHRLCSHYDS